MRGESERLGHLADLNASRVAATQITHKGDLAAVVEMDPTVGTSDGALLTTSACSPVHCDCAGDLMDRKRTDRAGLDTETLRTLDANLWSEDCLFLLALNPNPGPIQGETAIMLK